VIKLKIATNAESGIVALHLFLALWCTLL
jgi:hypothetical protein